jgi:leucine-rich repeat-containing protein 56
MELGLECAVMVHPFTGERLPNLQHLKLNNSVLGSIRDLGTALRNLEVLWVARCGVSDLDGISALPSLSELYLAFNDIKDLSPLTMLEKLHTLDLESNAIDDLEQVEYLGLVPTIRSLTIEGNPCTVAVCYRYLKTKCIWSGAQYWAMFCKHR